MGQYHNSAQREKPPYLGFRITGFVFGPKVGYRILDYYCELQSLAVLSSYLMVTDGVIDFYSFLSIIPKGLSFNSFPMGPFFMP